MSDFEDKFFAWLLNDGPMPPILEDLPKVKLPDGFPVMYQCGYCGKLYPEPPEDRPDLVSTCSERCDKLLEMAVDEARGK